jgi:hypothetical protein
MMVLQNVPPYDVAALEFRTSFTTEDTEDLFPDVVISAGVDPLCPL